LKTLPSSSRGQFKAHTTFSSGAAPSNRQKPKARGRHKRPLVDVMTIEETNLRETLAMLEQRRDGIPVHFPNPGDTKTSQFRATNRHHLQRLTRHSFGIGPELQALQAPMPGHNHRQGRIRQMIATITTQLPQLPRSPCHPHSHAQVGSIGRRSRERKRARHESTATREEPVPFYAHTSSCIRRLASPRRNSPPENNLSSETSSLLTVSCQGLLN
jgi:hypothetical protein